ncbi:MAG: tetratricopeptide repeat protein [Desulfovibrionaceae bacterium]|nr:tetratricopeptide repeat protein [Desulfovibrionaceae bacterium]
MSVKSLIEDRANDQIVREFVDTRGGCVVAVTEEHLMVKTLRSTLVKELGAKEGCVSHFADPARATDHIADRHNAGDPVIVFVERLLRGRPSTDFVYTLKRLLPDVLVIILVSEASRENLVLLHEFGADNMIVKPVSVGGLIEKMASTIKPRGTIAKLMNKGRGLLSQGDFEAALAIARMILEKNPDSSAGLMLEGDALVGLNRTQEAIRCYEEAHNNSNIFLEPLKKLADIYKDSNKNQYLKILKKLDRLSPLNTQRKCEIGAAYVETKELAKAQQYFDDAIDCANREAMSYVATVVSGIADTLADASLELSERYLSQLLEIRADSLCEDDLVIFNKLGIALKRQGKWRQAVDNYKKALTIAPKDEGLFYNLAMAYMDGKEYRSAVDSLNKGLKINPLFWKISDGVSYNLGFIYYSDGDNSLAEHFFQKALELNPDNAEARKMLSILAKGGEQA